jgi:glycosyltransferase involved in cell wall biosynthesis
MKIAVVHDYLVNLGGAERTVASMLEAFPGAPLFTSVHLPEVGLAGLDGTEIRTSFLQHLPFMKRHFRKYFLLYPWAIEAFDFRAFDVILSSSSAYAKFAIPGEATCHICYCYTPMRFAWDPESYLAREEISGLTRRLLRPLLEGLREKDARTAERVHYFIAISEPIRQRIRHCYGRDAEVISPPVETSRFALSKGAGDYYLVVSRLVAYKRIDLVVEAFNRLGRRLLVVGDGPHATALKRGARSNIEFYGAVAEEDLPGLYAGCRALVVAAAEDFGIAPVEAMACGRPVIAYGAGGALETVVPVRGTPAQRGGGPAPGRAREEPGRFEEGLRPTGVFFREQVPEAIVEAVREFEAHEGRFEPEAIRRWALRFDKAVFKERIAAFVREKWQEFRESRRGSVRGSHVAA